MSEEFKLIHHHDPGLVRFKTDRCFDCGRWWAFEAWNAARTRCPRCAGEKIAKLEAELEQAQRSNRALRAKRKARK